MQLSQCTSVFGTRMVAHQSQYSVTLFLNFLHPCRVLCHAPAPNPECLANPQFMRVIGAKDIIALGDCSYILDMPLPATAQVAGQQGAYVAHMVCGRCSPAELLWNSSCLLQTYPHAVAGCALGWTSPCKAVCTAVIKVPVCYDLCMWRRRLYSVLCAPLTSPRAARAISTFTWLLMLADQQGVCHWRGGAGAATTRPPCAQGAARPAPAIPHRSEYEL